MCCCFVKFGIMLRSEAVKTNSAHFMQPPYIGTLYAMQLIKLSMKSFIVEGVCIYFMRTLASNFSSVIKIDNILVT